MLETCRHGNVPQVWKRLGKLTNRENRTESGLYLDCIHPLGHSVFTLASKNPFRYPSKLGLPGAPGA